jgi:hypothetical protein
MDKLLGFLPDVESTAAGVMTDVTNLIPTENGMKAAPTAQSLAGVPALASACRGAVTVTKLDDVRRVFAGTATKLYELSGASWTDVSAGTYTGGVDSRWSFTQFGNATLATNLADTIQRSNVSGAFTAISGAPKAKIVFAVGSQVMALNTNDGTVKQNGWHCSASFNDTDWTPNVSTLCASGQLVDAPGQITAGGRLGEYAVAYKERALHIGQFVGSPSVWDWKAIAGAGCVGQDAWCDIDGAHFFVGRDSFWLFDGSRPVPVGVGQVRQWFFDNSNPDQRSKIQCIYDRQNGHIWVFFASKNSSTLDKAIVYHLATKKWGLVTIAIECALNYVAQGITIDGLSAVAATIDNLESFSFDSQYWLTGGRALSIFDTAHQLKTLTGVAGTSGFVSGDAGDDDVYSFLSMIRLRFAPNAKPTSAVVQVFGKATEGDGLTTGPTAIMYDGKFDVMQSARFHRAAFTFTGDCEVLALGATLTPEGNA